MSRTRGGLGWRSVASALQLEPRPAPAASASVASAAGAQVVAAQGHWPWNGVKWSITFVAILGYVMAITTYRVPIGTATMVLGIAGLLFERRLRFPSFLGLMLAFLAWATIGYTQTYFPEASWDRLTAMFKLFVVTFVVANALRSSAQLRLFSVFCLAMFAMYPVRGALWNYYVANTTQFGRAIWGHVYDNPNDLAAYCLLQLGLVGAVLVSEKNIWVKRAATVGAILLPFLIFLTQSRGGLIALGVFALLGVVGQRREISRLVGRVGRKRLWIGAAVALVAVLRFAPVTVWERMGGLVNLTSVETIKQADEEGSAEGRFEIWKIAWHLAGKNPLTGTGIGSYRYEHERRSELRTTVWAAMGQRDAHSTYLLILVETGIPGLAIFLAMIAVVFSYVNRVRRRVKWRLPVEALQMRYIQVGLIAFLIAGIFGSFGYLHFFYIFLAILWARAKLATEMMNELESASPGAVPAATGRRAAIPARG